MYAEQNFVRSAALGCIKGAIWGKQIGNPGFTRSWTISMPLYRRLEPNMQLIEYRCIEFVEEFLYGHLRKEPLVTRWEGETIIVDITRKVPPGDQLYEWYRK